MGRGGLECGFRLLVGYVARCSFVLTRMDRRSRHRDDVTLLAASRAGRGGFDEFYRRYRDVVLAFHSRRVGEAELAADLTAETFSAALVAVHERADPLPDVPAAWLFVIAQRKLIDSYRRGRVEDAARSRLQMEPLALEDADLERIEETARSTDVAFELARRLPSNQYEALRARVLEDRAYADIAGELDCSPSVVRMRVSRALKSLRTAMEVRDD
jgi:RNA polymerase sigma-70 factor (ECF subfamily)